MTLIYGMNVDDLQLAHILDTTLLILSFTVPVWLAIRMDVRGILVSGIVSSILTIIDLSVISILDETYEPGLTALFLPFLWLSFFLYAAILYLIVCGVRKFLLKRKESLQS
ncbi:MAG: hypothetical protein WCJ56_13190 [bacterium]